jgi:hypothetical protein
LNTTFVLAFSPSYVITYTAFVPAGFGDLSNLSPGTTTLEFPSNLSVVDAFRLSQARVITEASSPASYAGKITRFRNTTPTNWVAVAPL